MLDQDILLLHKDGNHGANYPRAAEFGDDGIPFVSAKNISESGELEVSDVQHLNEDKARSLTIGWVTAGDVLLAHNASVGKTCLYEGEFEEALIGTSLTAFRPNPEVLDSCYLLGALRSHEFQRRLTAQMSQTTRNQVPITAQRRLSVPVPPIAEQRAFSTQAVRVRRQASDAREHLEILDDLFASLQQRAFRGDL